jgi:hypothetical protein
MPKLSKEEITTVKAFIGSYNDLFKRITIMEAELDAISLKKDSILNRINELNEEILFIRKKEKDYNDYLVKKYGSFKLDMETFDINQS